ncbi:MAG TPA: response regulator transcription factor [Caulobacteraceae bacterium]|nr:response regulator transcription factor [Caulobacteraceae bacterium]
MSDKARILVVEDDASVRQLIRTGLGRADYEVHVARDGKEALEAIARIQPDAMVLDINMPELDGFGVLEALREKPEGLRPATMILTARHAEDDVRRAMALGAKDYLTKPFSETQLMRRIARLLRPPYPAPRGDSALIG